MLVVDDEDGIRQLIAFALRRAGFDVVEAADGQAALDLVKTSPVAMVVLDVGMPVISGTDVLQALRADPETSTLPVLLMTRSGDEMRAVEGLAAGADDFLLKPIRLDELVARINARMRLRRTAQVADR